MDELIVHLSPAFSVFPLISFFALFDYVMLMLEIVAPFRSISQRQISSEKAEIIVKHKNTPF